MVVSSKAGESLNACGDRGCNSEAEEVIEGVGELPSYRACLEIAQQGEVLFGEEGKEMHQEGVQKGRIWMEGD